MNKLIIDKENNIDIKNNVIELDIESTTEELHKIIGFIEDEQDSSKPAKGLAVKENDVKYDLSDFEE